MANWDDLKQTFFEETNEGLQALDAGLTDLRDGNESEDTVNAVFRAIHSVKGGAGVFGFEALVNFAHVFETVLNSLRHGTLTPTSETLDVLFSASDVLADFVGMARADEAVPPGFGNECKANLEQLIGHGEGGAEDDKEDEDFEIDFTPVRFDDDEPAGEVASEVAGERSFSISFRPKSAMLATQDPLFLLQETAHARHARACRRTPTACRCWPIFRRARAISAGPRRCAVHGRARTSSGCSRS